jgi:hypothetical protein
MLMGAHRTVVHEVETWWPGIEAEETGMLYSSLSEGLLIGCCVGKSSQSEERGDARAVVFGALIESRVRLASLGRWVRCVDERSL